MELENAIVLEKVSKSFKTRIKHNSGYSLLGKKTETIDNIVLKDVSLKIKKGEVLGLIGRNGSGKSTLLSLIAHILEPDSGSIQTDGKIASILELGMGFHPDMSGLENIYIKGEMYGFSKKELDSRIESIIEYAGITEFIDAPVRTYSSGMMSRLAFAIMVNVDADILLVDEVLSTGDQSFAIKAIEHFKKLSRQNKTIIFVSHAIDSIELLCKRAVWIDEGLIVADGPASAVCSAYKNKMNEDPDTIYALAREDNPQAEYKIAKLMMDNQFVSSDPSEDYLFWLKRSADNGYPPALTLLGDYLLAEGSRDAAIDSYTVSANKGNMEARKKLARLTSDSAMDSDLQELKDIYEQVVTDMDPQMEYRYADLLLKTSFYEKDKKEAFEWFKKSAIHGYANAMYQVAIMYRDGVGTIKDISKMIYYLEQAAEVGYLPAVTLLSDIYLEGKLIIKDDAKASYYLLKGALLGNGRSQYLIAIRYRDGIGIEQNVDESKRWFKIFSLSNLALHQIWAADLLKYTHVKTTATTQTLYTKAAKSRNSYAMQQLGTYSKEGQLYVPDSVEQVYWLEESSFNYGGSARSILADSFYKGVGVEQDIGRAIELYKSSATMGDQYAFYRLGLLYKDGIGIEKNMEKYYKCMKSAALRGNKDAISELLRTFSN